MKEFYKSIMNGLQDAAESTKQIRKSPKVNNVYEYADADGNRGMWVTYIECPRCGYELDTDEQEDQCVCGQLIDWSVEEQE